MIDVTLSDGVTIAPPSPSVPGPPASELTPVSPVAPSTSFVLPQDMAAQWQAMREVIEKAKQSNSELQEANAFLKAQ